MTQAVLVGRIVKFCQLPNSARKITDHEEQKILQIEWCFALFEILAHMYHLKEANALSLFELFFDDEVLTKLTY